MSARDFTGLRDRALAALADAVTAGCRASDPETAIGCLSRAAFEVLGDADALTRGHLKPGERRYFIGGYFMPSPDGTQNWLIAEVDFPPEQHRMRIPIDYAHPGRVAREQKPLLLANTDDHGTFKQVLKSSRMGSTMFAPMFWRDRFIGQMILAAQARNTFEQGDLDILCSFAPAAAALWMAHDGPAFLDSLVDQPGSEPFPMDRAGAEHVDK